MNWLIAIIALNLLLTLGLGTYLEFRPITDSARAKRWWKGILIRRACRIRGNVPGWRGDRSRTASTGPGGGESVGERLQAPRPKSRGPTAGNLPNAGTSRPSSRTDTIQH